MTSSADLEPEPDLQPIYPTTAYISSLLSADSGLTPAQKSELVSHCASRACIFADLQLLSFLVQDAQAQTYLDLGTQDEDGFTLTDVAILGFGAESDRDVEREECVRFLVAQGADVKQVDNAGWTPLHHGALVAPPTLVSYLLTHGCSPFGKTNRGLTPLDIVTAHSTLPGREDVALLLQEAMRGEGWTGGKMEQQRREADKKSRRRGKQRTEQDRIAEILEVDSRWWKRQTDLDASSDTSDDENEAMESLEDVPYTPPPDYACMLVFDPSSLPYVFQSIIVNYQPRRQDPTPAITLYMMARFACLTCDHTWLEELIIGATDAIEETFFNSPDDVAVLLFWLYNTTAWLHLMKCDSSINEACEMLGSFVMIEEVINSVFVFIIRFAERRIDQLLDAAILDYVAPSSEAQPQFESEWSFLKSFSAKKKPAAVPAVVDVPTSPTSESRQRSKTISPSSSSTAPAFQSFRETMTRVRTANNTPTPLQAIFADGVVATTPTDALSFMTALHIFMVSSNINPALVTQVWSQVMYWTACETFNRILTRKKNLCRSRAKQIGYNVSILENWVASMDLPYGIHSHFAPVRDLLSWLQTLSSINDFPSLISTIQHMRGLNPLQMRRAVREYKYEVGEGKMSEECIQYLAQLQKDWERHRVKLGVEALRKELDERERDDSESSFQDTSDEQDTSIFTSSSDTNLGQGSIDVLFDRVNGKRDWEPSKPPQVLGELLDSRFMLPLLLPSDPRLLSAVPGKLPDVEPIDPRSPVLSPVLDAAPPAAALQDPSVLSWRPRGNGLRSVDPSILHFVDGSRRRPRQWTQFDFANADIAPSPVEARPSAGIDHLSADETYSIARRRSHRPQQSTNTEIPADTSDVGEQPPDADTPARDQQDYPDV